MSFDMSVNGPIDIPNKSSFKVNEVCAITGVKSYVLRFWESEFEEISPLVSSNGNKVYDHRDVEAVLMIKKLLFEDKLSIDRAKAQMKSLLPRVSSDNDSVMPTSIQNYAEEELEEIEEENDYFPITKSTEVDAFSGSVVAQDSFNAMNEQVNTSPEESQQNIQEHDFSKLLVKPLGQDDFQKLEAAKSLLLQNINLVKTLKSKNNWL